MFGKAYVQSGGKASQISIPASLLTGTAIQPQVYKVKDGKAVLQNITISERIGSKVVVSDGLSKGDVIVTNGFINLYNDANVTFKQIGK